MSDRTRYESIELPEEYGPITVGTGEYSTELLMSSPARYSVGFTTPILVEQALELVPDHWQIIEYGYVVRSELARSEYTFEDVDGGNPMTPAELSAAIDASDAIRYGVPVYVSEDHGSEVFTAVPNHVVVTAVDLEDSRLEVTDAAFVAIDRLAAAQGFFPLLYRDSTIARRLRRVYSSLVSGPAMSPAGEFSDYVGEPGAAFLLIDRIRDHSAAGEVNLVSEADWFVSYPNDLGTPATRASNQVPTPTVPAIQEIVTQSTLKVAVLDGEFDLNHASAKLPFSHPRRNETSDTTNVGATNGHAHGTLCAGIIAAHKGISDWPDGGVAPEVQLLPISIYRTLEPVRAELQDLVDGINFAVGVGCKVLSISVAGFPGAFGLLNALQGAEDAGTLIVAGTGNRREDEPGGANFVQYPAGFGTVIGVGAATLVESDELPVLRRVSLTMTQDADEPENWESRFGSGIDVVAPGLLVTSTDISGDVGANKSSSPAGDLWGGFSGTSAATPFVAGFAAVIASRTGASPQAIRDEIRAAADLHNSYQPSKFIKGNAWHREVGFGWIDRNTIRNWEPAGPTPPPPNSDSRDQQAEDVVMTNEPNTTADSVIVCGTRDTLSGYSESNGYPYAGKFLDAARPLADFFASLASGGGFCAVMAIHFWRDPYMTARISGLPWHAAVLLGSGDWHAVYEAIDAEYHAVTDRPPGPIWVRTR